MVFKQTSFARGVSLTQFTFTICLHLRTRLPKKMFSTSLHRDAWEGKNKVMDHGVLAWKTGRRVPECCQQEEFSCPKKQEEVWGTTKVAVLGGDP